MVVFFEHSEKEILEVFKLLEPAIKNKYEAPFFDTMGVSLNSGKDEVGFNHVSLKDADEEAIRLVMLNTSQSVALDRYAEVAEEMLRSTQQHTQYLEKKGRLDIRGNKLKRYIGKTLNLKNEISENLYIFDSPDVTWHSQRLNDLNQKLKQTFDLKDRFRYIHERIEIIKENLELFKDIMDHKESSKLEWIIIVLIFVEVLDHFIIRFLSH